MAKIGMPEIKIVFESQGLSAIQRSERGIVLLLLKGENEDEQGSYKLTTLFDLSEKKQFSERNAKLIRLAFEANPRKLLVEIVGDKNPLDKVTERYKLIKFNYYAAPNLDEADLEKLINWHKKEAVDPGDRTIKFVGYDLKEQGHETLINWATSSVTYDGVVYTGKEFTTLVACQLAALPLNRSFTYFEWPKISEASLDFVEDPDAAVDAGKLFLTFDGEIYKVARGVNSYTGKSEKKGEDFRKIKIVDAMHLIKDDIRDTFDKYYVGKVSNTYANKQQFIAMINRVYFAELKGLVLQDTDKNRVDINVEENLRYAVNRGADTESMTTQQIKEFNTGSKVFLEGYVSLIDAMEDLYINFFNE